MDDYLNPFWANQSLEMGEGDDSTAQFGTTASDQPNPPSLHPPYDLNWNTPPLLEAFGVDPSLTWNGSSASMYASSSMVGNEEPQTLQLEIWLGEIQQAVSQQGTLPCVQPSLETQQQMVSPQNIFPYVQPCLEPTQTPGQLLPQAFHPSATASEFIVSTKTAQPHGQNQASSTTEFSGYRCDYPGCLSITEFARVSDFKRHQKKHNASPILCTAVGCDRGRKKPIVRRDKFREHVLTNHGHASLFKCPNRSCSIAPLPFRHLQIHFELDCEKSPNKRKARVNWGPLLNPQARICPISRCRKMQVVPEMLQRHLLVDHSDQERNEQSSLLTRAGYDPETCEVLCPICGKAASTVASYSQHLIDVHEIIENDHFLAWLDSIKVHFPSDGRVSYLTLKSIFEPRTYYSYRNTPCPSCTFRSEDLDGWAHISRIATQHKGLFVTSPELYEHREAILRLFPGFRLHPIFEDIRFQGPSSVESNQHLLGPSTQSLASAGVVSDV